jgi:NitT/TauT family transport system substrate-binding protein
MQRTAFLSVFGALVVAKSAGADAPDIIRAAASLDDDATPYLYAMAGGVFKKYGLDAHVERAASGSAVAASILGGAFEIGKSSITSFTSAHAHGLPLIAVSPGGEFDINLPQSLGMFVRADGPVKTGADLNGKTIAVQSLNDFFTLASRAWIDKNGGDSSTIRFTEVPMAGLGAAIAAGRIDAAILIEPFYHEALAGGQVRVIGNPNVALGPHFMQSVWFTSNDYVAKHPDVIGRFIRAMRESAAYANAHHAETAPLLAKFTGVDATDAVRIPQGVRFDPPQLQVLIDLQAKYKMIPASFDVRDLIYPPALR